MTIESLDPTGIRISHIGTPKIHYRYRKILPLIPIFSQINLVRSLSHRHSNIPYNNQYIIQEMHLVIKHTQHTFAAYD